MTIEQYPQLQIDLEKVKHNVETMIATCGKQGITVSGVVKGANGIPEVIDTFVAGGVTTLSSSRLPQLAYIKENHPEITTLMLRLPMLTEIDDMLAVADISLNSEEVVLKAINNACHEKGITHGVVLMVDLGDLREGFFDETELLKVAEKVEYQWTNLELKGIGTNLGCYGSIEPDEVNLGKLVSLAQTIEKRIGRKLEIVSGGATTTVPLVLKGGVPEGINHLRIGDGIFLRDMEYYFDYTFDELYGDCFTIIAELIEKKEKPSHPIGTISVDAFGNKPEYVDIGNRLRGLVAIGRQDVGDMTKLIPEDPDIKVIGGSSDHTILDLTDSQKDYQIGDKLRFHMEYEGLVFSSNSEYVHKTFIPIASEGIS